MELYKELKETAIGEKVGLNNIFDIALQEVFSDNYLNKIRSKTKKDMVSTKEMGREGETQSSFFGGVKIRINPKSLEKKNMHQKIGLLMHEFIHYLQEAKSFFIARKFKQVTTLTEALYGIVKRNLTKGYSIKDILPKRASTISEFEILAYFISDELNWKVLTDKGRRDFLSTIRSSGIFNLSSKYMKGLIEKIFD